MNYTYQAVDSVTGEAYVWSSGLPDPGGLGYPGPNDPTNILQTNRPSVATIDTNKTNACVIQEDVALYLAANEQFGFVVDNATPDSTVAVPVEIYCTDGQLVTVQLTPIAFNDPLYGEGIGTEMRLQCQYSLNGSDWTGFGAPTEYVGSDSGGMVMLSIFRTYNHWVASGIVSFRIVLQTPQYGPINGFRAPGGTFIVSRVTAA